MVIISKDALRKIKTIGGSELVEKMIDVFVHGAKEKIQSLENRSAWQEESFFEEAESIGHTLKSSAAYLGLTQLQKIADRVEQMAIEKNKLQLDGELDLLRDELIASLSSLIELRKGSI
ncbi:MAG: Hpt domain-containing protein [Bdellovibrionales bacterium]|nr:Hpt domain-containing protein [Bdellovibrionales bacterium]